LRLFIYTLINYYIVSFASWSK